MAGMGGSAGSSMSASLLGLKAELALAKASASNSGEGSRRKRTHEPTLDCDEASLRKRKTEPTRTSTKRAKADSSDKASNKASRNERDAEARESERVRKSLERKARIYAQLEAGKYAGVSDEALRESSIDWTRKLAEPNPHTASNADSDDEATTSHETDEREDPMVEYMDEFGRTRLARLSDIPRQLVPDPHRPTAQDDEQADNAIYGPATSFPVYDRAAHAPPPQKKHFDPQAERRYRGAAFYRFSDDPQQRQQQMHQLAQQHAHTQAKRAESARKTEATSPPQRRY